MTQASDRLGTNLNLLTLGVLVAIGVVSQFISGVGVHMRLDAKAGAKGAAAVALTQLRYGELSAVQLANFEWAMRQLPGDELQQRYGDHPTIRKVTLGEIMRAADAQFSIAKAALAKLATMDPVAVESSDKKYQADLNERARRLDARTEYSPVVTGISREPQALSNYLLVSYTMKVPEGLAMKFLPCTLDFGEQIYPNQRKVEFDCFFPPLKDGKYGVRVLAPTGADLSDLKPEITAEYSRAIIQVRSDSFALIDEVKPEIPETLIINQAYKVMKTVLDNKAYF